MTQGMRTSWSSASSLPTDVGMVSVSVMTASAGSATVATSTGSSPAKTSCGDASSTALNAPDPVNPTESSSSERTARASAESPRGIGLDEQARLCRDVGEGEVDRLGDRIARGEPLERCEQVAPAGLIAARHRELVGGAVVGDGRRALGRAGRRGNERQGEQRRKERRRHCMRRFAHCGSDGPPTHQRSEGSWLTPPLLRSLPWSRRRRR